MDITAESYVSLTTFRRDGTPVATPVWIAPLGDGRAGFTTGADSGKVKRIRNNPAVTLQACNVRGVVRPDAPVVDATARFVTGEVGASVAAAIRRKYRLMARLLSLGAAARKLVGRGEDNDAAIILSFD